MTEEGAIPPKPTGFRHQQ